MRSLPGCSAIASSSDHSVLVRCTSVPSRETRWVERSITTPSTSNRGGVLSVAGSAGAGRGRGRGALRPRTAWSGSRRHPRSSACTLPASSSRTDRMRIGRCSRCGAGDTLPSRRSPADSGRGRPDPASTDLPASASRPRRPARSGPRAPARRAPVGTPADLHLVVDDEDPAHVWPRLPATAIANVAPPPGVSSTRISPSIATANPLAIARPRPAPSLGLRWSSS